MTTRITGGVHVDRAELHHRVLDTGSGVITFGAQDHWPRVDVFFPSTADIDAVIAELVALRAELAAPVITDSGRTCGQANPGTGAWCHRGGDHGVHEDTDGETWRTGAMVKFTSGSRLTPARCRQPGEHSRNLAGAVVDCDLPEHRAPAGVTGGEGRCECSHPQDMHADAVKTPCLRGGCGCTVFRLAAPRPHAEPPAVVNGDVVLEVRALLS